MKKTIAVLTIAGLLAVSSVAYAARYYCYVIFGSKKCITIPILK